MSEPAIPDAATAFARSLVDEWVRAGVTEACVAPGSRSTPLALALASDGRLRVHVHLDERSASFFALGAAKASGRPVVVLCTSGTAAANFHPAVLEAHHARVPLLVCTADRPPELRDTGAGQTIDQTRLYGDAVRWFVDPGAPDAAAAGSWRSLASRAVAEAVGPPAGPVHLNLPFREPLVPTGGPMVDAPGRADGAPWTRVVRSSKAPDVATVAHVADVIAGAPRGVLVAGWGAGVTPATVARVAAAAGWPVLADPLSGVRAGPHVISTYDAMLRDEGVAAALRPDLVLRVGAPLTSKVAGGWLGHDIHQIVVDADGAWLDPARAVNEIVAADGELLLAAVADALEGDTSVASPPRAGDWVNTWLDYEQRARHAIDKIIDGWWQPFEGRIARDVVAVLPDGATLVVASSMPVRDVEWFAGPREGLRVLANRGVNGIDGFDSTVLGVAAVSTGPVVALLGDLCFLHDANGLLGAADRGVSATFVVVDNGGGGIFSFLPQADDPEHFETLFGTPQNVDLAALAGVHGLACSEVERSADVAPAVLAAVAAGGVRVVLVRTDRADNVARHREVWSAVARAVNETSST
jgi:2-succinyl-5-enolpyruvyl-6-hydroxy-3-cyclohexene-1-carboxylate synthase